MRLRPATATPARAQLFRVLIPGHFAGKRSREDRPTSSGPGTEIPPPFGVLWHVGTASLRLYFWAPTGCYRRQYLQLKPFAHVTPCSQATIASHSSLQQDQGFTF